MDDKPPEAHLGTPVISGGRVDAVGRRQDITIFHFLPSGPPTAATKKKIRSHAMFEAKRKQRQDNILKLRTKPSRSPTVTFEDSLCKCSLLPNPRLDPEPPTLANPRSAAKRQEAADSYKICPTCRRIQFEQLSQQGQNRIIRWHTSVAAFFVAGFDPLDSMPKLPFKLSAAEVHQINELKTQVVTFFTPGILKSTLLPAATTHPALLMGVLYFASAMLGAVRNQKEPSPLARAIKREALRQINQQLADPKTRYSRELIPAIEFLSSGIWNVRCGAPSREVEELESGAIMLVKTGPTFDPPEAEVLSRALIPLFALYTLVRAAVLLEPLERHLLAAFDHPNRPNSLASSAESPLYRGPGDFVGLQSCKSCSQETLHLLRSVRALIEVTLSIETTLGPGREHQALKDASVQAALAELSLVTSPEVTRSGADNIYETCRLTAILMVTAMGSSKPFRNLGETNIWEELETAMRLTDIGNNWGSMMSVLLWVSLIAASADHKIPQCRYFDSVLRRVTIQVSYNTPDVGSIAVAIQRFRRIQAILKSAVDSEKDEVAIIPERFN